MIDSLYGFEELIARFPTWAFVTSIGILFILIILLALNIKK